MRTTITVEGMSCGHCEQTVEEALRGVAGVTDVDVDRTESRATVEWEPRGGSGRASDPRADEADVSALVGAVEDAGYTARA
jgi:copper chaperone CopZ